MSTELPTRITVKTPNANHSEIEETVVMLHMDRSEVLRLLSAVEYRCKNDNDSFILDRAPYSHEYRDLIVTLRSAITQFDPHYVEQILSPLKPLEAPDQRPTRIVREVHHHHYHDKPLYRRGDGR